MLTTGAGQWVRAGMDGAVVGLDIGACLARPAAREADPDTLDYLLTCGERAVVDALAKARAG